MFPLPALVVASFLLLVPWFCLVQAQQAPAPAKNPDPATVAALRETIAQWIETERLISEESAGWDTRQTSMANLLELYRQELTLLNEELEKAGQSASSFDEKKTRLERETASLRAARAEMANAVGKGRIQLLELVKLFPRPLLKEVEPDLSQLREWKSDGDVRIALQSFLRILDQANRFATHISRSREVRDGRELEIVYLGVAFAYYLGADGSAGIARPENGSWIWQNRPELRPRIANILAQLDGDAQPALVRLPVPCRTTATPLP